MPAAGGLAFAAAERVIHRVHRDAAHVRPLAHPARAARLADRHVLVVDVADLAHRGEALDVDEPDLARRHLHRRIRAFLGDELYARSGRPRDLAALALLQLHVVDLRAERDVLERQAVARQDVHVRARHHRVADLEAERMQDVALLAVRVGHQRDARRTVRVVLDRGDLAGYVELVPLEINHAVVALVAAAAPPGRQLAAVVTAARAVQLLHERFVRPRDRDLVERLHALETPAGGCRLVLANRHDAILVLRTFHEIGDLFAGLQPDPGLLPVRALAFEAALPLELAVHELRPHRGDLGAEQRLDGAADVDFRRVARHFEHDHFAGLPGDGRLLRDERAANHLRRSHPSTSCSRSIAARVAMMRDVFITSRAVRRPLGISCTPAMLRADLLTVS